MARVFVWMISAGLVGCMTPVGEPAGGSGDKRDDSDYAHLIDPSVRTVGEFRVGDSFTLNRDFDVIAELPSQTGFEDDPIHVGEQCRANMHGEVEILGFDGAQSKALVEVSDMGEGPTGCGYGTVFFMTFEQLTDPGDLEAGNILRGETVSSVGGVIKNEIRYLNRNHGATLATNHDGPYFNNPLSGSSCTILRTSGVTVLGFRADGSEALVQYSIRHAQYDPPAGECLIDVLFFMPVVEVAESPVEPWW